MLQQQMRDGNWKVEVTDTLLDGLHDYTITATGANGETGILQGRAHN
ncbi:hypothetical protein ABVK34_25525 (plasmid) [Escherichia coli]